MRLHELAKYDDSATTSSFGQYTKHRPEETQGVGTIVLIRTPEHDENARQLDKFTPSIISGCLVVLGWMVVNKLQANRERRKQARERIAELKKDLADLESTITKYHTSPRDKGEEIKAIASLTRLERGCSSLCNYASKATIAPAIKWDTFSIPTSLIREMRKAMTLNHFQDEHLSPIPYDDSLIQEILVATDNLQRALDERRVAALD